MIVKNFDMIAAPKNAQNTQSTLPNPSVSSQVQLNVSLPIQEQLVQQILARSNGEQPSMITMELIQTETSRLNMNMIHHSLNIEANFQAQNDKSWISSILRMFGIEHEQQTTKFISAQDLMIINPVPVPTSSIPLESIKSLLLQMVVLEELPTLKSQMKSSGWSQEKSSSKSSLYRAEPYKGVDVRI